MRKDDFKSAMGDLRDEVKEVRMDMKEGFRDMADTLGQIFKKLDHKEDKSRGA